MNCTQQLPQPNFCFASHIWQLSFLSLVAMMKENGKSYCKRFKVAWIMLYKKNHFCIHRFFPTLNSYSSRTKAEEASRICSCLFGYFLSLRYAKHCVAEATLFKCWLFLFSSSLLLFSSWFLYYQFLYLFNCCLGNSEYLSSSLLGGLILLQSTSLNCLFEIVLLTVRSCLYISILSSNLSF